MTTRHVAHDEVRRFILENQPVRGHWVHLESAWKALRAHQEYPQPVRELLGQAVSASVLLAATLKFHGTLTVQLQGNGLVHLLVAQCTHDYKVRAVARFDESIDIAAKLQNGQGFRRLVGDEGRIVVTIEADEREARYQGIVPIVGSSFAESLEAYFASSEQLPTRVRLAADDERIAGLLIQRIPGEGGRSSADEVRVNEAWADASRGVEDLNAQDLLDASAEGPLTGRFGDRDLRLFKSAPVQFACRCSEGRVAGLLRTLGADEVRDIVREQGEVTVTCEFCQRPYRFDAFAVEQLFTPGLTPDDKTTVH